MFEDALIRQIRYALSSVDGEFDVTKESGRIYVKALGEYEYDDTIEALKRVFGIADICPMVQIEDKDYENLKKHVVEYMDQVYPDKNITFKVDARRGDKQYPVSSEQINRDMGEAYFRGFPTDESGCTSSGCTSSRGDTPESEPVLPDDPRTRRYAYWHQWTGNAVAFRRY